jgi:CHASE3 domain sensor protein
VIGKHRDDLIVRAVSNVPCIEQDRARAERTRARCRRGLDSRARAARRRRQARRRLETLLVGGFFLAYLVAVLGQLL